MTFLCIWRKIPRTIMLANNIKLMSKEIAPTFSTDDVAKIKKFCKTQTKDIFDHLSKSLAPNVHGHEYIKKAILCMLLRGNEKVLNNGTDIKEDINILLLGQLAHFLIGSTETTLHPHALLWHFHHVGRDGICFPTTTPCQKHFPST
ncbi:maternal DNA replication licensing factor mcm3-like [Falco biarmicus]|uniref:maternal DNA replication licensing factor mcm3-like n=1 Tax=Falco biarmicus TaxID=345155 RepID=UPI0024BC770C|nr:maternal DNA replication licensing factor mcm3-like [Falco biarmicus]